MACISYTLRWWVGVVGIAMKWNRVWSAIQARTNTSGAVKAGSVEKLIRTMNARLRHVAAAGFGAGWAGRLSPSKYFIHFKCLCAISFRAQCFSITLQRTVFTAAYRRCGSVFLSKSSPRNKPPLMGQYKSAGGILKIKFSDLKLVGNATIPKY